MLSLSNAALPEVHKDDIPSTCPRPRSSGPIDHNTRSLPSSSSLFVKSSGILNMAQPRDTSFNPSSPRSSSGGADSYKHDGTPDTRLTAFSPEDGSARSNKLLSSLNLTGPSKPNPVRFHVTTADNFTAGSSAAEKDPFVSSGSTSKPEQTLSPTASAFRPVSVPLVAHSSQNGLSTLNIGPSAADFQHLALQATSKLSTELQISRYIVLFSSKTITVDNVEAYLSNLEHIVSPFQGKRLLFAEGNQIYIRLSNIRDARNVHDNVQIGSPDWRAGYISPLQFYQVASPGSPMETVSEGQVFVVALPASAYLVGFEIEKLVYTFLRGQGDIFAFQIISDLGENSFRALVEFSDVDVAVIVASKFNGIALNGTQLLLTLYQPDINAVVPEQSEAYHSARASTQDISGIFQTMSLSKTPQTQRSIVPVVRHQPAMPLVPQQQVAMYPVVYQTVSGPRYLMDHTPTRRPTATPMTPLTPLSPGNMPIMGPMFTPPATPMTMQSEYPSPRSMQAYNRTDGRSRQNAMRVNRTPFYNAAGHHNHVDVNRIREGIDVRTTIMLRNIPNKVDQAMLKRIVDESSWGKYDFMYLRIDFANDCNVGYAFINFVDPLDIIDFVNARGNQRWNCFKSDKVAEISYATIQGKDCLVQKFRNSSVMLEARHYRPKLYFTSNGPRPELAGEEEEFPEPDNQSKMKRSCENAEHVGLFTPNAGQHFRDEQRRRRSQYDRGTRLAALEEYDYDAQIQQQGLYNPQ